MYSLNEKREIVADLKMVERIIDKLNSKFDPTDSYHHRSKESEMFEFQMKTDHVRREAWQIVFMGRYTVASGSFFGFDYSDCQEEEYITLEAKNEMKIYMLAVNATINVINDFINYVALADVSDQNKNKWAETLVSSMK